MQNNYNRELVENCDVFKKRENQGFKI